MNESATISVVMSVYNGDIYLDEAISSILNQSYKNIELIIVNDGSSDRSCEIIQAHMLNDSRIKLFNQSNSGLASALNLAISKASGEWIARMDADDISTDNRLATQLKFCLKKGLDFCGSAHTHVTSDVELWRKFYVKKYPETQREIEALLHFTSAFAHPSVFARASLLKNNKYNVSIKYAQDFDLWVRILATGAKVGNIKEPLLNYRVHSGQASVEKRSMQERSRNSIALNLWPKDSGVNEVVRFNSISQCEVLMNAVKVKQFRGRAKLIVATEIAKTIIRSFPDIPFKERLAMVGSFLSFFKTFSPIYLPVLFAFLISNRSLR